MFVVCSVLSNLGVRTIETDFTLVTVDSRENCEDLSIGDSHQQHSYLRTLPLQETGTSVSCLRSS